MINNFGGIVNKMPNYSVLLMIFTLGAVGLPGTTGFIGEFLILMGTFKVNIIAAVIASIGVILSAAYMLWMYRRVIFGDISNHKVKLMSDLKVHEIIILWALAIPTIFFGFYPEPFFLTINSSVSNFIDIYNFNLESYVANK